MFTSSSRHPAAPSHEAASAPSRKSDPARPQSLTEPGQAAAASSQLGRSVFLNQLLLAAAVVILVVVVAVAQPAALGNPSFFLSVVVVFLVTCLAAVVPWHSLPKIAIAVLPIADIAAVCVLRNAEHGMGASYLLVFPVIWMASHFGVRGAIWSVVLTAAFIWGGAMSPGAQPERIPLLVLLPVMLAFVAATTHATTKRTSAQKALLRQQAGLFETALRRSRRQEQLLDEIFNAVDFGVVGFDANGKANLYNRAQREMLARVGSPLGQPVPEVMYGEDMVTPYLDSERPSARVLRGETVERITMWAGEPGQTRIAVLVSARPLLDDQGNLDGGVIVSRDVTAEMRAIQARDDLVASVSHELRTPLTSILGYLELSIDDDRLDPGIRTMLEVASKNADRMLALVSDLLTAASDSKGVLMLAFAHCEMSGIIADAVDSIRPLASERDITFELPERPVIQLEADAFRLRQVADNLLSNAVKYNVHGGCITVTLDVTEDDLAELRVTDTGRGMTNEEQQNLFDRFYRADSVRGSNVHGTGLGLSISRDIMRQHRGDLRLESEAGRGTTAIATLPLRGVGASAAG
jgi:two-component system phosphate regulon sensor histidine kinase PhoR